MSKFNVCGVVPGKTCPWCAKERVTFKAIKRAIKYECGFKCGYYAWVPKRLLKYAERRFYYGRKSHKKSASINSLRHVAKLAQA